MILTYYFKPVLYKEDTSLLFEVKSSNENKFAFPRFKIEKEIKSAKEFDKQIERLASLLDDVGVTYSNKPYRQTALAHQIRKDIYFSR